MKEYKLYSIYNLPIEMCWHSYEYGWEWENWDGEYKRYGDNVRYFETYNGRKVTINTLTGKNDKNAFLF